MPSFLPPDDVRFELSDGKPVLRVAAPAPDPATADRWSLFVRATMCVLDGPGEDGYLLARLGAGGDAAPTGWDDAVHRAGGCLVVFGGEPGGELFVGLL
ncbi:hypothetical protein [Rugosimonospora africana]|uniref:Uncharacterized protein n=1 Tax=Rugosimonospora africana TaxID=556532 RepID=A0A8J3QWX3_9ACTN|nr:hypothetical protein [Rugosimonospora africana]GIH18046.1 hypothetical protein Raf01_62180 [Rugosimonospora africana]